MTPGSEALSPAERALSGQIAGFLAADADGTVLFASPACGCILGTGEAAVEGRSLWELSRYFGAEKIRAALQSVGLAHCFFESVPGEIWQAYFTPEVGRAPENCGMGVFLLPVFEEYAELFRSNSHSEKLEAIGKVTGKLGHDFNNFLGAISGCIDLMKHRIAKSDNPSQFERQIKIIESALRKSQMLTAAMRGFVRPGPLHKVRVRLADCLRTVIDLVRDSQKMPCEIIFEAVAEPAVEISEFQVVQMVTAICLNALDAMRGLEERVLMLRLGVLETEAGGAVPPGRWAHLAVIDHGSGLSQEAKARVFQPFFTTKSGALGSGMGLGLAMAQEIMHKHGGEIRLASVPGCGTVVHLYFPLAEG